MANDAKDAFELSKTAVQHLFASEYPDVVAQIQQMNLGEFRSHYSEITRDFRSQAEVNLRSDPLVAEAFKAFDPAGSGYITKAKLHETLNAIGMKVTDEEAGRMVDDYARAPNRGIALDEFVMMMAQGLR